MAKWKTFNIFNIIMLYRSWLFNIILGESYPASLADGVMKLVSKGDKEEATDMNIDTTPSLDPQQHRQSPDTDTAAGL